MLIQLAHPVLERSQVTRPLVDAIRDVPGVTINDLYERYPTLSIDARAEQRLLLEHDVVVFHHPFYWYSTPAILKQWQDIVLEYGWAYGEGGDKLHGKLTLNALTTGGPEDAYRTGGSNRFTVRELLAPWEQTANLCGMRWLPPWVVHGVLRLGGTDELARHRRAYRALIETLRDDRLDVVRAATLHRLNGLEKGGTT